MANWFFLEDGANFLVHPHDGKRAPGFHREYTRAEANVAEIVREFSPIAPLGWRNSDYNKPIHYPEKILPVAVEKSAD
jgi:hypothetical protein